MIARQLANELSSPLVAAGTVIDIEEDLMKRLGTSRATLREGLRLLEMLGVVESRLGRNGGIVVQHPDAGDFAQLVTFYLQFSATTYGHLVDVHAELAPIVAAIAARDSTDEARGELAELMVRFDAEDPEQQMMMIPTVQAAIAQMVPNPIWRLFAMSLQITVSGRMDYLLVPEPMWAAAISTVRKLVAAIDRRDGATSSRLSSAQAQAWREFTNQHQAELMQSVVTWT